ncbi:intergrin alpha chain protein, putative [Leishmania guyanensis]|uniref:FG-GAP repeat protein, putative,intergrin alpha chain protein, putative n=1 Tax=Leishmania guyanensis TaxID=5670 RepID=A0A1E1J2H8_LEIGU|nr:FG-GAP repeat protein, putative,intergrin alpha chain protein, putative [Leishmania guyanensis]
MIAPFSLVLCALLFIAVGRAQYAEQLTPNSTSQCYSGLNLGWSARVGSSVYATPRIVDLAHDGHKEVLIPTFSQFLEALDGPTGEDIPGFPFMHPRMKTYASPLPVDLNGDGQVDWLVALYTGELVIFGSDGKVQGYLQVPPLTMKRNWVRDNLPPQQAANIRPGTPIQNGTVLEDILRARHMDDLTITPDEVLQQRSRHSLTRRRHTPTGAADMDDENYDALAKVSEQDVIEDKPNPLFDADELDIDEEMGPPWVKSEMDVGPNSHLSPEARASLDLLFHPELYRTSNLATGSEETMFEGRNLRRTADIILSEDEIKVDAHILATPVVTDVDQNGDLDVILHVSYFFSNDAINKHPERFPDGVDPHDFVATAVVCLNLVTGETRWAHLLHASTKNSSNAAYALSTPLIINADEDRSMEVYVSTSPGFVFGFTADGKPLGGWPVLLGPLSASPTAEDVTGDGTLDICIGDTEGKVRCYNASGTIMWEKDVIGGVADRLTFGDVDGDGVVDVVFGTTSGLIYALRGTDGTVLPSFPIVTGGSIVAPVLLLNLNGMMFGEGLDIVVPSHNGRVYLVRASSGCVQTIDIDEKSSSMVLADDVLGNGQMDLVVTTINGGVYVFETATPYTAMNAWPSKTKGVNGCSASGNHVGISISPNFRTFRDIRGDTFNVEFTIYDARPVIMNRSYAVDITVGTRIRLYRMRFDKPGTHNVKVRAPLERMYSSLNVVLTLPNGQSFTDSISLSFNMYFMHAIKYTLIVPFLVVSAALMLVHKRHEVVEPEAVQYLF